MEKGQFAINKNSAGCNKNDQNICSILTIQPNIVDGFNSKEKNQPLQQHNIEKYISSSDQSSILHSSPSRYEESMQNYSSENSWDEQPVYSGGKLSSQTEDSLSSINVENNPQRNSVLTQKINDQSQFNQYLCNQYRDVSDYKMIPLSQQYSSSNTFSQPHMLIECLQEKLQEQKMKREESQMEVLQKEEKQNDSENFSTKMQKEIIDEDNQKEENMKMVSYTFLDFNTDNMSSQSLFCDIPFCLNNFVQEAEGDFPLQRVCSYNNFKKVVDIRTFRNGMMMDCTLTSFSGCSFNQDYLIKLLESKGNQTLFNLAQSIRTYYNVILKLTPEAQNIIQNYDQAFLEKRISASREEKERILSLRDPRTNFYFKTYTINWENFGSPKVTGYGFSKGFCDIIGLSIQENKQYILRKGFLEFFSQNDKIRVMLKTCLSLPWNMKREPIIIKTKQKFITYDNIVINNAPVNIEFHNLSNPFDEKNNFKCPFSEFMIVGHVDIDKVQESRIKSSRINRDRRQLDDLNNDEMDFYYSKESQSFLERYYKDIYGERYSNKKQLRRCEYVDINF